MNKRGSSIFWGGIFILAAAFIIVSQLGYLGHINMVTIILSVGLGAIIIHSIPSLNFAGILVPTAFLCILYDQQWGITELTPWPVLITAILGSIGLSLIFKKRRDVSWGGHHSENFINKDTEVIDSPDGSRVSFSTKFGAGIKYVNSDDFQRADLQCDFGGLKVYFDNAIIQGDSAEIYIKSSFGGMEIYIPKNWRVENHIQTSFGGLDEHKRKWQDDYDKIIKIYGNVNFSGVDIYYV